jgi:hypothetical protein
MPRPDDEYREEGFLGRWARRKKEAQQPAQPAAEPAPTGTEPAAEALAPEPVPEMVEPPSLDLVDKDFDVAHWLKQNVPEEWKLKALRRAWESDPAIAGYLDPARDYALDWNTPGGAPAMGRSASRTMSRRCWPTSSASRPSRLPVQPRRCVTTSQLFDLRLMTRAGLILLRRSRFLE